MYSRDDEFLMRIAEMNLQPDAFLLTSKSAPALVRQCIATGMPCVRYGAESHGFPLESVVPDNVEGGTIAAKYLLGLGHRAILFAGGEDDTRFMNRYLGFKAEMIRNSIDSRNDDWPLRDDLSGILKVLRHSSPRPTAIIAGNDAVARTLINEYLTPNGVRVAVDISIIGFDDSIGSSGAPLVTTVGFDKIELGRIAIDRLRYRMEHPFETVCGTLLPMKLLVRDSCATLSKTMTHHNKIRQKVV